MYIEIDIIRRKSYHQRVDLCLLQMCTDAACCKRRVCFFAHSQEELRKPTEDSDIANLRSELLSQSQQQQQRKSLGSSISNLLEATQLDNIGVSASSS